MTLHSNIPNSIATRESTATLLTKCDSNNIMDNANNISFTKTSLTTQKPGAIYAALTSL